MKKRGLFKRKEKKILKTNKRSVQLTEKKIKRANKDLLANRKKKSLTSKDSIYKRGPNCPN